MMMPSSWPGLVASHFWISAWATWSVHMPATWPTILMSGVPFRAFWMPRFCESDAEAPGIPSTTSTLPLPLPSLFIQSPSIAPPTTKFAEAFTE